MDKIQTLTNSIYEYAGDEIPPRPYYGTFSPWREIVDYGDDGGNDSDD